MPYKLVVLHRRKLKGSTLSLRCKVELVRSLQVASLVSSNEFNSFLVKLLRESARNTCVSVAKLRT